MLIRDADPQRDAPACAAIYAPYVRETAGSFEGEPPAPAQMAERIAAATRTHAWIVLEDEDRVVGYAYGGPHALRGRAVSRARSASTSSRAGDAPARDARCMRRCSSGSRRAAT
jgi:L-amino acid N-acyltransferase YncA